MFITYKTALSDKKYLADNIYLFTFKLVDPPEMNFIPGQYLMLNVPKGNGFVVRLYSIASPPLVKNAFELIVEIIPQGLGSTLLNNLKIGDEALFQGPEGAFTIKKMERQKIFWVTGTGIAPIRAMLKAGATDYRLFWGLKTYKDLYLFDELKQFNPKICLSREGTLDNIPAADRQYFDLGHVDDCTSHTLTDKELMDYEFYLCGGKATVESLKQKLLAKNILQENIHIERF